MKNQIIITRNEAVKNGNSAINQKIKGQFIERNVNMCVSYLMDELFKAANEVSSKVADLPQYEDIENLYTVNRENLTHEICEGWKENSDEIKAFVNDPDGLNRRVKTKGDLRAFIMSCDAEELEQYCNEFGFTAESEPQEILEWWAIDSYLFDKLKEKGEPVLDYANMNLWGRTCSGQAILLDHVITEIAADMEILEGQANSWA